MSTADLIRRNSLFSFASQGIRLAANVLLFVGIARFYGAREFGQFTTAHTYMTLFFITADFGFDLLTVVRVARNKANANATIEELLPLKMLFSLASMLMMLVVMLLIPVSAETRALMAIMSAGVVGNALLSFFLSALKGFEIFQYETQVAFIQNTSLLAALIVLGILKAPITIVAAAFVISRFLGLTLVFRIVLRQVGRRALAFSFHQWKTTLREAAPYGIHLVFGTLFFTVDTILLSVLSGEHAVGVYQSVFKLAALALVVCDVVVNTLVPTFARFHADEREQWRASGALLMKFLVWCGAGIGICMFLFAGECMTLVYGRGTFLEGVPIFRIFAAVVAFRYAGETFGMMLTTAQRQATRMKIVAAATALNVAANLFAIPRYGVEGAAIVSLATNGFVVALFIINSAKIGFGARSLINMKFIGLTAATLALIAGVRSAHGSIALSLGAVAAAAAAWTLIWFTRRERALAYGMVRSGIASLAGRAQAPGV